MHLLRIMLCLLSLAFAIPARAEVTNLSALAVQLAKVRTTHGLNKLRDAGPELTPVKQALRAWIEQQLPSYSEAGKDGVAYLTDPEDLAALGVKMSQALDDAGLTCGHLGVSGYRCNSEPESERGYVDRIRIASFDDNRYLMVITGVGVQCGFDQSAYLYEHGAGGHWRLLLRIEQDRYGDKDYRPENFLSVGVSSSGVAWNAPASPPLVAMIGYTPWCSSNWNMLNTRLWRTTSATPTPRALMDRDDELFLGDDFIAGMRLTQKDLLVQFDGRSIDADILVRPHVLHYSIGVGDTLTRVSPLALNPGDFVEEWLTRPWTEASHWLAPGADRRALARLHGANAASELDGTPKQCRKDTGLWQVNFSAVDSKRLPPHFLVRWQAPYAFTLVAASNHVFPGCDKDAMLPSNIGTLFSQQGWTP